MAISQNTIGIFVVLGIVTLVIVFGVGRGIMRERREKGLMQTGIDGKATVVEIIDTGSRSGHDPICRVILSVQPATGEAFRTEKKMTLSAVDLTKFKEGSVVPVKINPDDRSEVLVIR